MNTILLVMGYLFGFFFSLGFHLEDCKGAHFMTPLLLAVFWPIIVTIWIPFSGGIWVAKTRRGE